VFGIRRRKVPADARPPLDRDERIVAWASTSDGPASGNASLVVVTNLGVWLPGRVDRLGWHQIHKATWSGSRLTVVPAVEVGKGEGYAVMADGPELAVGLADPNDVPPQVRNRVTRSVAYTAHHAVPTGGARVVARRVPGVDGVSWNVRFDEGTDATAPGVAEATAQLVALAAAPRAAD
jgi:hypothetical protein